MDPEAMSRFAFAAGASVALLCLFHLGQRLFAPAHTLTKDARGKNDAYNLLQSGHVLSVLLLVPGIVREATIHESLLTAAAWAAAFVVTGVLLIQVSGSLGVRLLLRTSLDRELDRGNVAAGLAAGANYVAVGILAASAVAGSDLEGLGLSAVFFGLAVVTLELYVSLFRALTTYDDSAQILGDNLAAAVSYAGISISVALVLSRALSGGEFTGWGNALAGYAWVAASALALYPVRQILVQGLILHHAPTLRGGRLDDAIGTDRNTGLAVMEALAYLATAIAIVSLT